MSDQAMQQWCRQEFVLGCTPGA